MYTTSRLRGWAAAPGPIKPESDKTLQSQNVRAHCVIGIAMLPSHCSNQQYECISLSLNISETTYLRAPRARVHRAGERAGPALILHAARLPCSSLSLREQL